MTVNAQEPWQEQADDPEVRIDARVDPALEDAYWQSVYLGEPYCRRDCGYDDYAPAYCVGYIGYAQYGGSFDDAEKSLCANWLRIKGDSRLSYDEALPAIRAAWQHAGQGQLAPEEDEEECAMRDCVPARTARQPDYATA